MKKIILVSLILLLFCCNAIADDNYIINGDTVYIDDSNVYLSATPHTLSSSGLVYFNLTSKVYAGNIDVCWGFNTSVSKPTKAELYKPHWVNTTTNHEKTFYNPSFITYTGDDLDYGNSYNINYKYTITESIINDNGTTYITSNAAFDSFDTDGINYTIYWHNIHDNYYLWKDFSSSFNSVIHDYKGYNKWYYIKNVPITSNKKYTVRAWIDVPVSTEKQSGKYYFAIKPSHETISQAVTNGHFYNLDPWWDATWLHREEIILTGGNITVSFDNPTEDGHIFKSIGYTRDSTGNMISFGCEDEAGYITRGYIEWDISSLPTDANITNVTLKYHGYHADDAHIHEMIGTRPSISGDSDVYNESGEGTVYADVAGFPVTGTNKEINLGINAISDLELSIANGWFAVGLQQDNENPLGAYSGIYSEDYASVNPKPTLYVEYTSESEDNSEIDYQLLLNVTYESEMQTDFDDLRFCNETHELDAWLESKVDSSYALIWVEFPTTPTNGVEQTYYMYYGNAGAMSDWDGAATFLVFEDGESALSGWSASIERSTTEKYEGSYSVKATGTYNHPYKSLTENDVMISARAKQTSSGTGERVGLTLRKTNEANNQGFGLVTFHTGLLYIFDLTNDESTSVACTDQNQTDWYNWRFAIEGSNLKGKFWKVGDSEPSWMVSRTDASIPAGEVGIYGYSQGGGNTAYYDEIAVSKYVSNPPTYQFGSESYYANSIHYNSSNPYNHTIQSDSTIIVNRSITAADDINWTAAALTDDCNLVVTEYNLSNATIANFTLYNATLDWLKVTNLTVGVEYRLTNNTVYEEHIADASGEINFTNNLIPDDYQIILESIVNITCYSVYPETLFTNYTGLLSGSYIVESNSPLNYSSLAFLMGMNYTLTDDYHSYLKVPANSIASDGIYRAHHRNVTPYLSWEGNDTITEGNAWKWGGGDNDSFWISKESINATHTWVNITGVASNVFPSMFYLGRLAMYESPKTEVEINKGQGIIFKFWDIESLRARDCDFWVRMFFDTQIETTPSDVIDIWYCNNSFNPAVDDPVTCEYCSRLDTWSSTRWLDHEDYQPHNNVSYSKPLIYYAGEPLAICPDDINYVYLTSETQSSKSYILNATNSDPGICNLTYAQTQTMWLRNEVTGTNTPYAYTPSFFMATVRDYLEFTHHLYIANNQDVWGHSDICTVPIGISDVPPTHCRYNYFWWDDETDYYMNGSYEQSFWVNLTYGVDPDNGEPLTHVLSLYDDDYNFIAFVNSSLTGNQTDVDIWFDITDYKADNRLFILKIVSTDNEGSTSVSWSSIFELPSDNTYYRTIEIIKNFPSTISNILTSFLSYLPLFVGILISGFLILICVSVFGKLKQW